MKGELSTMPTEETAVQTTETGVKETPAAEVQTTETQETQKATETQETSEPKTQTGVEKPAAAEQEDGIEKAFAARLAKERQKIEQQHTATLQRVAKASGFPDVESYLAAVESAEKEAEAEAQAKLYQENPTEAIEKAVERKLAARDEQQRVYQQKMAELEKKPFFADLKADITGIYNDSFKNGQTLDLDTVYNFVLGQRAPELIEKAQKAASQSTIAQVQDRAKRGLVSNDSSHADDIDVSEIDVEMANAFGNDPKEVAKYVKQQTKRS